MIICVSKLLLVMSMALLASLVSFGNLTDYGSNLAFVQHVFLMDTIFPGSAIRYRAITSSVVQNAGYVLIIALETVTAVCCWIGAFTMWRAPHGRLRIQPGETVRDCRTHARVPHVAGRVHVDRRRMVRHVDVLYMERRGKRVPVLRDLCARADFRESSQ
jgi:hypothetical protein